MADDHPLRPAEAVALVDSAWFPLGTLTVNVVGSFVLAPVTFAGSDVDVVLFVGTGVYGSFTTFSSFFVQTVRLWVGGERFRAALIATLDLVGALLAVGLGWLVVAAL